MSYTFDGNAKTITLVSVSTLDLIDLHSRWKDWVATGNAKWARAMATVGGEIPAIPLYLFLMNGWRIVPMSSDHVLTVTDGILETTDGSDPFIDPAGAYKIRINRQIPGIAIGYTTSAGTGADASSVWSHPKALTVAKFIALK